MSAQQNSPTQPVHIVWKNVGITYDECRLACALFICLRFQDGTKLDDATIGQVVGSARESQEMDIAGLVNYLQETSNVYPDVLSDYRLIAPWAWERFNKWLDPCAALGSRWP